jgi:deoxyadenosine/deoxycytidine kinase
VKVFEEDAVNDQTALAKRLGALAEFNRSEDFKALDTDEKLLLQMQEHAMYLHLYFLAGRINNFGKDEDTNFTN